MDFKQDQIFEEILDYSNKINSSVLTITRCLLLTFNIYFRDGLQYRELKTALNISDGKLASNLNFLVKMGYINKKDIKFDNKKLHIYNITHKGKEELKKILNWMDSIKKLLEEVNIE